MEDEGFGFDEFSVEMGDYEVIKTGKYNYSFWLNSEGGSIDNKPLVHNGMIYFGSMNRNIYALDLKSGKEKWRHEVQDRIGLSSPQLYKDSLIIGSYDYNVYRIDLKTGEMIWKFHTNGELASSGAVMDGVYYFTGRDQFIYAINCEDGSLVWKFRTFEANVSVPTIHKNMIFFGSSDRNLYCLDRKNGSLIWKFGTEEEVVNVTPFQIIGNGIHFGTQGNILYAVDIITGKEKWRINTGEYGMSRGQIILDGMLIQPTNGGNVFAVTPAGKVVWKISSNHPFGAFATDGERLYAGCEDHHLYCLDKNGKTVWKFRTEAPIWQPSTILDGIVYFGSYDCNLYALDAADGTLMWKFRCPGGISIYPPIKSFFEFKINVPKAEAEEEMPGIYGINVSEGAAGTGAYKSRITYQLGTHYREKGRYQKDADEEAF